MNDTRTEAEKRAAWFKAYVVCRKAGWECVRGWEFRSPIGTLHDLSAADLKQLKRIERDGLFILH